MLMRYFLEISQLFLEISQLFDIDSNATTHRMIMNCLSVTLFGAVTSLKQSVSSSIYKNKHQGRVSFDIFSEYFTFL